MEEALVKFNEEIIDSAIKEHVTPYLYNNGKGKWIPKKFVFRLFGLPGFFICPNQTPFFSFPLIARLFPVLFFFYKDFIRFFFSFNLKNFGLMFFSTLGRSGTRLSKTILLVPATAEPSV